MSNNKVNEYNEKFNSLKTEKAKDNHTKKIYTQIQDLESSLASSSNSSQVKNDLNKLKDRIEDIYS